MSKLYTVTIHVAIEFQHTEFPCSCWHPMHFHFKVRVYQFFPNLR